MALSKTVDFKGITVPNAYIRVSGLTIQPGNTRMGFGVDSMVSADAAPFDTAYEEFPYRLEGGNPIRQAYDHLKTLERFQGAEDC